MISSHQTGHAIVEELLDDHMARRFQYRLEPQHDIEIIIFKLSHWKRSFGLFDVNVDARRVSRDALDERGNHEKVHIVGCRDYEAPHGLRRVEFLAGAD